MPSTNNSEFVAELALVAMPWNMPDILSVQIGTLKSYVRAAGHNVVARHYYKDIVSYIGKDVTQSILDTAIGEALFGAIIFPQRREKFKDFISNRLPKLEFDHTIEILRGFLTDCISDLMLTNPRLVGFTTTHMQLLPSIAAAQRIKEINPRTSIVFGGISLAGEMARDLLQLFPCLDYIVVGEGELALLALLDASLNNMGDVGAIPGVLGRHSKALTVSVAQKLGDLGSLPVPDYDEYFSHGLKDDQSSPGYPRICVESARGCRWGKCTFCIEGLETRRGYRTKSAERVSREILELSDRYKSVDIVFADPDTSGRGKLYDALSDSGVNFRLAAEVAGLVSRKTLSSMKRAGLDVIQIGIESFSPTLLGRFKKGVRLIKYVQLMKWCKELGLDLIYNVISGAPFETQNDVDVAVANMGKLMWFKAPIVSTFVVSVGSEILTNLQAYNISRVLPSEEALCYPEEFSKKIGPLLTFHAGYNFESVDTVDVDRVKFHSQIELWKEFQTRNPKLIARFGARFIDVEFQTTLGSEHILIDDIVDVAVCRFSAQEARSVPEFLQNYPHIGEIQALTSIEKLTAAGLIFTEDREFFFLPSAPLISQDYVMDKDSSFASLGAD